MAAATADAANRIVVLLADYAERGCAALRVIKSEVLARARTAVIRDNPDASAAQLERPQSGPGNRGRVPRATSTSC